MRMPPDRGQWPGRLVASLMFIIGLACATSPVWRPLIWGDHFSIDDLLTFRCGG